jgi:hypothetical protein
MVMVFITEALNLWVARYLVLFDPRSLPYCLWCLSLDVVPTKVFVIFGLVVICGEARCHGKRIDVVTTLMNSIVM